MAWKGCRIQEGRGRPSWLSEEQIAAVITRVTQPPAGQGRWSVRSMAKEVGISAGSVYKLWKSNDLKPHPVH